MKLRWLTAALADLENILDHAAKVNVTMARNIAARVERTERAIETFPEGAHCNAELDVFERYVPRTRVILIYRLTEDEIVMIGAFHTSREPGTKPR